MIKIIKISNRAVIELLGEYFIENYDDLMKDKNQINKILDFYCDDNGEFLCVSQDDKNYIELSDDDKKQIISKLSVTTESLFNNKKKFNSFSKEEFLKLLNKKG